MASGFDCRPIQVLQEGQDITFNGAVISRIDKVYIVSQPDQTREIQCVNENNADKLEFLSQRARGVYIASVGRPDLAFGFAVASQVITQDCESVMALNKQIRNSKTVPEVATWIRNCASGP